MDLPNEYLMLRQPTKVCEVVHHRDGKDYVRYAGGRVAAKKFLTELRKSIGWDSVRAFCHKENGRGPIVEIP